MTPILQFLQDGTLPPDKTAARRIRYQSARYTIINNMLYRRGFSLPYLRCLDQNEARQALAEVHQGACGNHSGGRSLSHKLLRQGYYWPTIHRDASEFTRRCDVCQRFAHIPHQPPEYLTSVTSPWPFAKWGIDLIGPFPPSKGQNKFAIVAMDYFTKWVEAEPLARITKAKTSSFIYRAIICRFGIPHTLVTDNGKQFDNARYRRMCADFGITPVFSSSVHPQSNGQIEAINKIIKETLKTKLGKLKGAWADELPQVLWSYRTTPRGSTKETPYALAFGTEAVIPIETAIPSLRVQSFDEASNDRLLLSSLDLLKEKRSTAQTRVAFYQQQMANYYNSRVKHRHFCVGQWVLRKTMLNTKERAAGSLAPAWEGPYKITKIVCPGTYRLEDTEGRQLAHPWNAEHLKRYYQ